jgi:protein O-mannosyl-transferase
MRIKSNSKLTSRSFYALVLLVLLILVPYAKTFKSSWHLDDYPNIIENQRVHLKELNIDSLFNSFFIKKGDTEKLSRPVPRLTFALNWYFSGTNITGYHILNIAIHIITAFLLYLSIINLFKTPNLRGKYKKRREHFVALLTALMWAVHPIQTQAVTYIVQRMTLLAALFYLLSIYLYIKARIDDSPSNQKLFIIGCALSFILAMGSKENTVVLPLAILLVEVVFFQDLSSSRERKKFILIALVTILGILTVGILFYLSNNPLSFLKGYKIRSFSLSERLMTEPRILIYYFSQIFYPVANRFSIEHDFRISTSLLEPWSTIPAIIVVFVLIAIGVSQIRKRPILSFGILFFFLNHLIESTVIPLELIFEHRNYLPTLFLFYFVSLGLIHGVDHYHGKNRIIHHIIVSFIAFLIIGLCGGTYIRNMDWVTEKSLWEDAMKKAPGRARPPYNLARQYYFKTGRFDQALFFYERAFQLKASKPKYSQALCLNGMASIYYLRHEYDKVIKLCKKALEIYPGFQIVRLNLIRVLIKMEDLDEALTSVDVLIVKQENNVAFLNLKGFILVKQGKLAEALLFLDRAHGFAPRNKRVLLNLGVSLSLAGEYSDANKLFQQALQMFPDDIVPHFYLIENSIRAEDLHSVDRYLTKLLFLFDRISIESKLKSRSEEHFLIPFSRELIAPVVHNRIIGTELHKKSF